MARVKLSSDSNKYFTSYFDEDIKLYSLIWHSASEDIQEDEYKELLKQNTQALFKQSNQVNYILINVKERLDTMAPELQEWSTKYISAPLLEKYDVQKVAVIRSQDFSTQFSIEQAIEEDNVDESLVRYFDDEQEAHKWFLGL